MRVNIDITPESPAGPDGRALIAELETYLEPLYPAASQHGFSVEKLINEGVAFFVLRLDGQAAACGGLKSFGREYAELKRIYVRPQYRGRGLARAILQHLEAQALAQGLTVLRLETGIHQPEAIALYEGSGYRMIGPFGEYAPDPLSICYEKVLIQ